MNRTTRLYDLDWLRILSILAVFVFHSGRFFDLGDWHLKNTATYLNMQIWSAFQVQWLMPVIFIVSGASTYFALSRRSAGQFLRERLQRLLVPLLLGAFTHVAVQVYIERLTHYDFRGSFFDFYAGEYFKGWYGLGGNFAWMGLHLWYLLVLFVFSLLFLPLLRWLRTPGGQALMDRLGALFARSVWVYLLALPVIALINLLDPGGIGMRAFGGWSLFVYMLFFLYGYWIYSQPDMLDQISRLRWLSLGLGIGLVVLMIASRSLAESPFGSLGFARFQSVYGLSAWCWLLAIIGFARRHLRLNHPRLAEWNEMVLPFYILHQSVLIYVGYFIVPLALPGPAKWALIALPSLALILLLVQYVVKPFNGIRLLFGMKARE